MAIYSGVTREDEYFHVIIPDTPLRRGTYLCGRSFHTEPLLELSENKHEFGVVFIKGDHLLVYRVQSSRVVHLKNKNVSLQKRQSHGGQSQNRIARLAEESRLNYVKYAEDTVRGHFSPGFPIILAGSKEMLGMLKSRLSTMKIVAGLPVVFNKGTVYQMLNELNDMVKRRDMSFVEAQLKDVFDHVRTQPELLVYGTSEITRYGDRVKCVYAVEGLQVDHANVVQIPRKSELHSRLNMYGGCIGVLYYATDDE